MSGDRPPVHLPGLSDAVGWLSDLTDAGLLADHPLGEVASWWHTDGDLGRDVECFTDVTTSHVAGFTGYRDTTTSFTDVFARLADARITPDPR